MNFLAHIYLSGDDDQLKIGNFIADSVKGKGFIKFPERIQQGIVLHRAIDTFTDAHPIFRQSSQRLFPTYSHYSTVIVDILYDHFLAANWKNYSSRPLDAYVQEFYELLQDNIEILPKPVQRFLPYMINDNWLLDYATLEGIGRILSQMNRRTKYKSKMDLAVRELDLYYMDFEEEFKLFFKDLIVFTENRVKRL
jgi:acyl carrier protein phosphodiesterase